MASGNVLQLLVQLTVGLALFYRFIFEPAVPLLLAPPGNNPAAEELRFSGYAVAWVWAWGWLIAFARRRPPRDGRYGPAEQARVIYTLGCVLCVFHVALVFHAAHEWSHQKAFDHTKRTGGVGEGVYVNYLFVLVWTLDVGWAWVAFDHYLHRPRRITWAVHGFMGFVVFNAAVVFATGMTRWFSLVWMAIPLAMVMAAWLWAGSQRRDETPLS
jgi:hypothetical protein